MATYYKYKKREPESQINWRDVTKTITDDMETLSKKRDTQRGEIDKAVLTNLEAISKAPKGALTSENQRISSYAEQASAFALEQQKLLKNGVISLKEYTSGTNNSQSSTKRLFGLSTKYQENYQTQMDAIAAGTASNIGAVLRGGVEQFGQNSDTEYYVDPATGAAYLAITGKKGDEDAKIINGKPMSLMDVSTAENIIGRSIDKFQSDNVSTSIADGLGRQVDLLISKSAQDGGGVTMTREDALQRLIEDKDALNLTINSQMTTDTQKASMLFDTMGGQGYIMIGEKEGKFFNLETNEEVERNDKTILFKQDQNSVYQPELTEDQRNDAIEGVVQMIKTKTDYIEKPDKDTRLTPQDLERRKRIDAANSKKGTSSVSKINNLTKLFYANEEGAKAAALFIRGLDENENLKIKLEGSNMLITRTLEDGSQSTETISKEGGIRNFVESASTLLNLGIDNVGEALSQADLTDKDGNDYQANFINLDSSSVITKEPSKLEKVQDLITNDIDKIELSDKVVKNETDLREALAPMLSTYGVNMIEKVLGSDELEFILGEQSIQVSLKEATPSSIKALIKNLINSDVKVNSSKYKAKLRERTQGETGGGGGTGGNSR